MHMLITWLVLSVSIWLTAMLVPGFEVRGFKGAVIVGAIFGLLNFLLGHFLFGAIAVLTLGIGLVFAFITHWIVTTLLIKVTDALSDNLTIKNFSTAAVGAAIMSLIMTAAEFLLHRQNLS